MQDDDPLATLRDIHLPVDPPWWPPAPGWWFLAVVLVATVTLLIVRARRIARRRQPRQFAMHILAELEDRLRAGTSPSRVVGDAGLLLRRVALHRHPRTEVAGLTGVRWLEFLEETGGGGAFTQGPGRQLISAPFARDQTVDAAAVLRACAAWIQHNTY